MPRQVARRVIAALLLCLLVPALAGWSNGPSGGDSFGTHDWALFQANRLATARGVRWLDWSVAQPVTEDPDTVLHDTYHHVYDIWGSTYGDAPSRVQTLYDETVQHLRNGDSAAASRSFGLLAHYYADICNPLHTDQCSAETAIHSKYELAAQTYSDQPNKNSAWVVPDGVRYVPNAAEEAQQAATSSHASYALLVSEFSAKGMDARVVAITTQSLNRAANDLADLMSSAASDAHLAPQGGSQQSLDVSAPTSGSSATAEDSSAASPQREASGGANAVSTSSESAPGASSSGGPCAVQPLLFWAVVFAAFAGALFGVLRASKGEEG
jgi:hypothetical protein